MSAEAVNNELMGNANHHETPIWRNVAAWAARPKSLQDKVSRLLREFTENAALPGNDFDVNRPGGQVSGPLGPRNALFRVLFELTLWLPQLSEQELRNREGQPDTAVGYARQAVSYLAIINRKLDQLLEK